MNRRRFTLLVEVHHGFVRRVLRRSGVRGADIGDLTQDVFIIAYEHRDELPRIPGRRRNWLRGVAFRVAQNWRRLHWNRRVDLVDPLKLDTIADSNDADMEALAIISEWIESLPRPRPDVVRLRLQGLSFTEIAAALMMSRSMVFVQWQKVQAELLQEGER